MIRDIEQTLTQWKKDNRRRPLLIRGARQVGKSYVVSQFGKREFKNFVEINFELQPHFNNCFSSLEPDEINQKISILTKQDIKAGETLLFFDEIQKCPPAIKSLRYYHEKTPHLHVIGAGSLLEFVLKSEKLEMPVGRIQYLYMNPLSFGEFLNAINESRLRQLLTNKKNLSKIDDTLHSHALALLKKYYIIGGMPCVVDEYAATLDVIKCQHLQTSICQTYRDDFGKYASHVKHKYLEKIFDAAPKMAGQKFKYANVDKDTPSRELKEALELLERAGVVHKIKATSGDGLPLESGAKDKHFKTLFLDTGLMQNMCGLSGDIIQSQDLLDVHKGAVAEQFVGQELAVAFDPYTRPKLYYWLREAKNSSAEIDYLIAQGSRIVPLEVKSGPRGKLRSLTLFMDEYKSKKAVVISQGKYKEQGNVVFLPLYGIECLRHMDC
ncbi:MAG: ATP-binding protein [Deltaproteobacteria bacterium]|nr:ATP-binding protein [Deltaproteobacteria bacterium]